jgi:hypothetical protein
MHTPVTYLLMAACRLSADSSAARPGGDPGALPDDALAVPCPPKLTLPAAEEPEAVGEPLLPASRID